MTPDLYHGGQIAQNPPEQGKEGVSVGQPAPLDEVGIDWLDATFKDNTLAKWLEESVCRLHGGEAPEENATGRQGFTWTKTWPSGVAILTGHPDVAAQLHVPGHACAYLGGTEVMRLLNAAVTRGKITRLDIRRDLRSPDPSQPLEIIEQVFESRHMLEFVGARKSSVWENKDTPHSAKAMGFYFGSSKSERMLRVYDKGMEQGGRWPGRWIRWEVQLRRRVAHAAAARIVSSRDQWRTALEVLMSSVEFRYCTGAAHVEDRPFVPWFAELCKGLDRCRPALEGVKPSIGTWIDALHRQYGMVAVAAADAADMPLERFLGKLFAGVTPHAGTLKNPMVGRLARWARNQP